MSFAMVPILLPKNQLDPAKLLKVVENSLTAIAKDVKVDFDTTTRTWRKRPVFIVVTSPYKRVVSTDDDVYRFLARGTSIRYATMSADFRPKTRSRYIGSNIGKGGAVFISKKYPKPGIQAREWEDEIKKKWDAEAPVIVQRMIDAALPPKS